MIYLYLLLCNILFIPCVLCSTAVHLSNESDITNHKLDTRPSNDTKLPLLSEGGSILPHGSDLVLPKETHNLPSVESEIGRSRIKPRKEAIYTEDNVTKSQEDVLHSSEKNITNQPINPVDKSKTVVEQPNNATKSIGVHATSVFVNKDSEKSSNTTKFVPKKPLTLNADKLLNTPIEVNPSLETLVKSQMPSPNKEKAYIASANSHPGMVMPIVITILLVPMFAVLGYMALRRGQEAWKNRHYKRMDFLLDGMYND